MRSADEPVGVGYRCVGCGLAFVASAVGAATCPRCQSIGGHERVSGVRAADGRSGGRDACGPRADSQERARAPVPPAETPAEHGSPADVGRPAADARRPTGDGGRPATDVGRPTGDGGRPVADGGRQCRGDPVQPSGAASDPPTRRRDAGDDD